MLVDNLSGNQIKAITKAVLPDEKHIRSCSEKNATVNSKTTTYNTFLSFMIGCFYTVQLLSIPRHQQWSCLKNALRARS